MMRFTTLVAIVFLSSISMGQASDKESDPTKKLEEKVPNGREKGTGVFLDKAPETDERSEPTVVKDPVSETFNKTFGNVKSDPNCDKPGVNC